jgi:Xaa-Pro aminopeptidase
VSTLADRMAMNVSTAELERRWAAVRAAMREAGIDVLVCHQNSSAMGGYFRYLTDTTANLYSSAVIFPADDEMTVIGHGPIGGDRAVDGNGAFGDPSVRGVRRVITDPGFASASYTRYFEADNALKALAPYAKGRIGLLATGQMSLAFGERLREELPDAIFTEASDLVDSIRAIKSLEEQELIRTTAVLQSEVLRAAVAATEPGRRERDISAAAWSAAYERGCEAGIVLIGSAPSGQAPRPVPVAQQTRVIEEGDTVFLLVEVCGPGGLFSELGRTVVVGDIPDPMAAEMDFALGARELTLKRLVPGADPAAVWEEYNDFLRTAGRPQEQRIHAHGQGCDLVERPLVRSDESMPIEAGMNLAVHPMLVRQAGLAFICDGYLIGDNGPERLHDIPETLLSAR